MTREELLEEIERRDSWQNITAEYDTGKIAVFQKEAVQLLLLSQVAGFDVFRSQYNVGTIYIPYNELHLSETGLLSGSAGEDIDIVIRL